ncbi:hypothetical protein GCM10009634_35870 [Saccharothrix xinjiangensis]
MVVDVMAWAGTAAVAVGVLTRLPAATTKFVRALIPLARACRDLRAELRGRQGPDRVTGPARRPASSRKRPCGCP